MKKPSIEQRNPRDIALLDVNARFMRKEQYDTLVRNVARDGFLSSVPLVYHDEETGRETVLSGNHRIMAARDVGLESVDVMVITEPMTEQQRIAVQLSHNAIVGEDDPATLRTLYESLDDVDWRDYSGLDDQALDLLDDVNLSSLSEANLDFTSVQIMFLPTEKEAAEEQFERATKAVSGMDARWIAAYADYGRILDALQNARQAHLIGNIAVALGVILDLFERHVTDLREAWYDDEIMEARKAKQWVPINSIFGMNVPAEAGAVIAQAVDKAVRAGDVTTDQRWQWLEQAAAEYLAGR